MAFERLSLLERLLLTPRVACRCIVGTEVSGDSGGGACIHSCSPASSCFPNSACEQHSNMISLLKAKGGQLLGWGDIHGYLTKHPKFSIPPLDGPLFLSCVTIRVMPALYKWFNIHWGCGDQMQVSNLEEQMHGWSWRPWSLIYPPSPRKNWSLRACSDSKNSVLRKKKKNLL